MSQSNLTHDAGSQLGFGAALLDGHVERIVGLRPEEQMVRVAASRRIAAVQNAKSIRHRAIRQFPGQAMCVDWLARLAEIYLAIAFSIRAASPKNAPILIRLCKFLAKPNFNWNLWLPITATFARAKLAAANFEFARKYEKFYATEFAGPLNLSFSLSHVGSSLKDGTT